MPTTRSQTLRGAALSDDLPTATDRAQPSNAARDATAGEPSRTHEAAVGVRSAISSNEGPTWAGNRASNWRATKSSRSRTTAPDKPLRFTIDLSLPPEERYPGVCNTLRGEFTALAPLFDEVVGWMVPWIPLRLLHVLCWLFLRAVYDREQYAELEGIRKATGLQMYLLICFNVLLDLLMGCSSGGATVSDGKGGSKMLHFRTLDWDMPALRRIVVHLDFVAEPKGPVLASSITYAGFVGVLTGVRKGLSMSLNFRPSRDEKGKFWADLKYYWHLLMRVEIFASTACYICFCSGGETTVIEKDFITARVRSSSNFIVITNNDEQDVEVPENTSNGEDDLITLADIIEEAKERRECAENNWRSLLTVTAQQHGLMGASDAAVCKHLGVDDVLALTQRYPTTNEMTHFACVVDPQEGTIVWCRRWIRPVSAKWITEHSSQWP